MGGRKPEVKDVGSDTADADIVLRIGLIFKCTLKGALRLMTRHLLYAFFFFLRLPTYERRLWSVLRLHRRSCIGL